MISKSVEETTHRATDFVAQLAVDRVTDKAVVVALSGDLGSGKTTFTQAVARALGITETVTSPTFVIEKVYKIDTPRFKRFIHIDAYRLETSSELAHLGFADLLTDKDNLIFIEWAEKIADILPPQYIKANFTFIDDTSRDIVFEYA